MSRKVELFFQKSIQLDPADINVDFKLTKEGRDRLKDIEYASVDVLAEIEKSDIAEVNKGEFSQLGRFFREDIDEFFKNSIDSALQKSRIVSQLAMPKIYFFFYKDDQGYVFNIMDQGIGFSEDYIEKFNRSGGDYQHNSGKVIGEDLGGAGLGMKNLKEKVQKVNGQCRISNRLSGSGASIMITLPVLPKLASDKLLREEKEGGRIRTIVGKIAAEERGNPIAGPLAIESGVEKQGSIINLDDEDFDEEDLLIRESYAKEKSYKLKDGKLNEPRNQGAEVSISSLRLFSPSSEKLAKPVDFITPEKSLTPGQY